MNNPKISVVFPVFNAEAYLEESITSILDQSFKDFELILIEDGSKDGSKKILKEFKISSQSQKTGPSFIKNGSLTFCTRLLVRGLRNSSKRESSRET